WVTGLDLQPEAVASCRRRLADHGLSARGMHGDVRTLTADADYDALLLMAGLLSLLVGEEEQLDALRRVRRALRPGDVLVLEQRNLPAWWRVFGRELVRRGALGDGRGYELGRRASGASFGGWVYERRWAKLVSRGGDGGDIGVDSFEQHDYLRIAT